MDASTPELDFLRHQVFLQRLARGLVGPDEADDLVQDVWTRALAHPVEARARGWLAAVARNLAANRFRGRARRQRREREAARPETQADVLDGLDERLALGRRVAAAVATLDAPYREVILLRFAEGLAHADIARRLGVPVGTVRTRQQRALARLRERLDRECGGREAWSLALAAFAGRGTVAAPAGSVAAAAVAAGIAVAVGAVAWWVSASVPRPAAEPAVAAVAPHGASVADTGSVAVVVQGRRASSAAAPASAAGTRHLVQGRVAGLSAAELRDARVEVDAEWKRFAIDPPALVAPVSVDGAFEVEVGELLRFAERWANPTPPDELVVTVEHPLHLREPVALAFERGVADAAGDLRFDFGALAPRDAAVVRGHVLRPDGSPASGADAEAYLLDAGVPRETSAARAVCAEDGGFDLRIEVGGEVAVVGLVEGLRPAHVVAGARVGTVAEAPAVRLEAGFALHGRTLRLGTPLPRAQVTANLLGERALVRAAIGLTWVDGRFEWSTLRTVADDEGRFAIEGLGGRELHVHVSDLDATTGTLGWRPRYTLASPPLAGLDIELDASLVTLLRTPQSPPELTGRIRVARDGAELAAFSFRGASDPRANTFLAPPDTPLSLSIELEGLAPIPLQIVTPGPGEELVRTLDFAAPGELATLELEWEPDPRLDVDAFRVYFESPEGAGRFDRGFHAEDLTDGVLRLEDVPPGRHRVRIHAGRDHLAATPALDRVLAVELAAGETRRERFAFELGGLLEVEVRAPSGERRRAQFRLLDADGAPVETQLRSREGNTTFSETWLLQPRSAHTSPALPAGDYVLVLWDDDVPERRHGVRLVAGETTALAVVLSPE